MFQDEADEPSSPGLFQDEPSEGEGCEGQPPLTALKPACVLQDEPDEIEDEHCLPFGIEPDEQLKLYIFFNAFYFMGCDDLIFIIFCHPLNFSNQIR